MGNEFQHPYPLGTDSWTTAVHKLAVLYGQTLNGQISGAASQSGQTIPANDEQIFTYYASSNNVANIIYKLAGQQVAQQNFEYLNGGLADDDEVTRITLVLS